ncbi:MAG: hypothetical protein ACOYL3_15995 [Desulfuromonadaceae bacterium]
MKFSELVNTDELRELCESYTANTGAATALLELDGTILIATDGRISAPVSTGSTRRQRAAAGRATPSSQAA